MSFLFSDNISNQNQSTLFRNLAQKKPEEEKKTNINSSLFNNNKQSVFGNIFGNNIEQNKQDNKNQNTLFSSNITQNLFGNVNNKEKENISNDKTNQNKGELFFGFKSPDNKEKKEENENTLFKSPGDKIDLSKNLFPSNNTLSYSSKKKEKEEIKDNQERKDILDDSKTNINKNSNILFGKNEEIKDNKEKILFEKPTSKKQEIIDNSKSHSNILTSTNILSKEKVISTNAESNLSESQRIEDNKEVQTALQNLYISDILLPSPFSQRISLIEDKMKNKIQQSKKKKSRTIDFRFYVEIKDIPNINDNGCNMICKSDESMKKLMKQAQLYVRKKYKMTKEQNDFDIILKKNGLILPINDNEIIGDYIKNNDKIIICLIHNSFANDEEEQKIYIVKDYNNKNEEINDNKSHNQFKDKKINNNDNSSIEEENINNNSISENSLDIIIDKKEIPFSFQNHTKNNHVKNEKEKDEDLLCPTDKLPILKRKGYFMNPDEYTISRMTIKEIKNVENFSIFNENGKIEFEGTVSLYGANLDKLFNIEHDLIEYEKGEWYHSPRGKNFNVPAVITFYNIHSNIDISNENNKKMFLKILETKCKKYLNGDFISYDFDNGTLIYKIPYFY